MNGAKVILFHPAPFSPPAVLAFLPCIPAVWLTAYSLKLTAVSQAAFSEKSRSTP